MNQKISARRGLGFLLLFFTLFLPSFSFSKKLSSATIKRHVQKILNYGPRPSGSYNLKKAQKYIINHLKKHRWKIRLIRFSDQTPLGRKIFTNIVALPKNYHYIKKLWVVAVHYESKVFKNFRFVGANDNTAGVGLLLTMADLLNQNPKKTSVALLFLDGEEAFHRWSDSDSLYGSRYQAKLWKARGFDKKIKGLILLDMIGDKEPCFCREENSSEWLVQLLWKSAKKKGLGSFFKNCSSRISDDHLPFIAQGIPAVDIIHFPFPSYWHTRYDTIDKLSFINLAKIGDFLIYFLHQY